MQKIILYVEHTDSAWFTPKKIGNVFINRSAIDEDASPEFLKIVELEDEHFFHNRPDKETDHFIISANIAKKVILFGFML